MQKTVILGAGPAGLSAAYELSRQASPCVVLEQGSAVGGLSRTEEYKGYCFDIGGHRFFTKVALVEQMWKEVLGDDLLTRPRLSRIYYRSKFFQYPIDPLNALQGLGPIEAARCALSYLHARLWPQKQEDHLEAWISNRFGERLYTIFFKTYTEKVWGMACTDIRSEWAAQRIRGLSVRSLLSHSLNPSRVKNKKAIVKTLIHEFLYPRRGPGMMWSRTRDSIEQRGSSVVMDAPVDRIDWKPGGVESVSAGGKEYNGSHFISSLPLRDLIERLRPAPPDFLRSAVQDFAYRDFITVALMIRGRNLFPDNWIYVHDPGVRVGRVQNYNNWSEEMVPDPDVTCLGLEYFCFEGDGLWNQTDGQLRELASREIAQLGLADPKDILDSVTIRVPKAYPIYNATYERGLAAVRRFLAMVPNLQTVGRNGMHRYNNQDHSMLTGILAARNVLGAKHDLWGVNADSDYQEEIAVTEPRVPQSVARAGSLENRSGLKPAAS